MKFGKQVMASKDFNFGMHLDIYVGIWFKLGKMIDTGELCILILVFMTLTLIKVMKVQESKIFHAIYLAILEWIWIEFGMLLTLVGLMSVILILCLPFSI